MKITLPGWPQRWSREQRSSATIALASVVLVLLLWLMAIPLALAPEPRSVAVTLTVASHVEAASANLEQARRRI